jgi:hypothetical protein
MGEGRGLAEEFAVGVVAFGREIKLLDQIFDERWLVLVLFFLLLFTAGSAVGEGVADFFAEVREVGGGDLEGVEDGAGDGTRHLSALQRLDDLHEGELEGGGVLDEGDEARVGKRVFDGEVVEAAEVSAFEGGLGAGLLVKTDVGAARGLFGFFQISDRV